MAAGVQFADCLQTIMHVQIRDMLQLYTVQCKFMWSWQLIILTSCNVHHYQHDFLQRSFNEVKQANSILIIGGGAVGVELAGNVLPTVFVNCFFGEWF